MNYNLLLKEKYILDYNKNHVYGCASSSHLAYLLWVLEMNNQLMSLFIRI